MNISSSAPAFGIDLSADAAAADTDVPLVVSLCVAVVDNWCEQNSKYFFFSLLQIMFLRHCLLFDQLVVSPPDRSNPNCPGIIVFMEEATIVDIAVL